MRYKILFIVTLTVFASLAIFSQRPPGMPGQDRRDGREMGPGRPEGQPDDWIKPHDTNQNGNLEDEEFRGAVERTFAELDSNGNGVLEVQELQRGPKPRQGDRPMDRGVEPPRPEGRRHDGDGPRPGENGKRILPPFFFNDRVTADKSVSRAEFDSIVRSVFAELDKNSDGTLSRDEGKQLPKLNRPDRREGPPPPQNAQFIGAELRFGDTPVKGQPFSAETVIEDTRMLFDGTLVKNSRTGAIYRDGNGRVRREQPLEMVGGVSIVGSGNKPQKLVFIHDFTTRTQYFLDENSKTARKTKMPENPSRPGELEDRPDVKTISDGTKTIDGVTCEQTRTEHEIPAGQVGNEKPLKVVSEKCYSPELQVVIMSLHQDPMSGLHVFKLKNIKRAEPTSDLFAVPSGYRIEN
ncbi:MAG: hypothetical protein QM785_13865 [Pyrinomonadaceae bacterium]